jgi:hypothetical protein
MDRAHAGDARLTSGAPARSPHSSSTERTRERRPSPSAASRSAPSCRGCQLGSSLGGSGWGGAAGGRSLRTPQMYLLRCASVCSISSEGRHAQQPSSPSVVRTREDRLQSRRARYSSSAPVSSSAGAVHCTHAVVA